MTASVWLFLRPAAFAFAAWVAFALLYLNLLPWAARWLVFYEIFVIAIFVAVVLYCMIRIPTHLYRKNVRLALAQALACMVIVLCFVEPVMLVNGLDYLRFYASEGFYSSCIKPADELGRDAKFGVCEKHFLDPNFVRLTVYASSDGLSLPEGSQSAEWKKFVLSSEDGTLFGVCPFSSRAVSRHFYFVDFNCEEPPLIQK
jgi:hypothetical protein